MRPFLYLLFVPWLGCRTEISWPGGTGVGNPGTTKGQLARGGDIDIDRAVGVLEHIRIDRCDLSFEVVPVQSEIDLLDSETFDVPGGRWCGLKLEFLPPLTVEGSGHEAGSFELRLDVDLVQIPTESYRVDGDAFIVELAHPEWIKREDLDLENEPYVLVDASHPLHGSLVESIERGSALFVDLDEDGTIDSDERATPAGEGAEHEDEDDDE